MSLIEQATSSTYNIQLFIDALADYAKITGIDLATNPFAAALEQSNSPQAILQLLHGREKAFKEYRDGDRRLISCLSPAVKILQAFSGILGEAASLIPFPPANILFAGIDALLDAASGVTSSYDALLDLFECLGNFLKRLEIYTTIPPTPIMTDIIIKIMVQLLSVLALATKQIKQGRFKTFAKKLLGDSEVEAVVQRLDRLTQEEARMAATQTLGVVHGLVDNMKVVIEDGKASTDSIRQDLVALHQVLREINKMKSDQLRCESRNVQHWLSPPDPSTNHNFVRKARHNGTATWFFESNALTEWKSRGSLLWIHGKPGAGKSTLLSAIIHDVEGMRAAGLATIAYYYFDFRDVKKQDCYGLLSSLISQLSAESDSCFQILSKLYSDHGRGVRQPDIDALKKCITDMLNLPGQAPIYMIVDAIDECPNSPGTPSAREEVLKLIEELVNVKLLSVHLCVASRPEMDIRAVLEPLNSLKISLHEERGQNEDIIEYIRFVVRSDWSMRRWKEEDKQFVIDTLSNKADGMFRWVVCQIDRLRRTLPASIRRVLNDLPKTLDETYGRTLLGIDEEKREYAQRLLRCLTVSIRPLRVEELAEILAVQFYNAASPTFDVAWRPENAEEAVLFACSSLITIVDRGEHQIVQFSHYSVKEFLTSERLATADAHLSYYHILPEPAHTTLAHACLTVLLQLDDNIDRNTIDHFPLAPYAGRHWVDHAQYGRVSSHVKKAMESLFDRTKPHFAAWVWLYNIDRPWVDPMSKIHPTEPEGSPLYYAALCGFSGLVGHLLGFHSPDRNRIGDSHTTWLCTVLSGFWNFVGLLVTLVSYIPDITSKGNFHTPTRLHFVQPGSRIRGAGHSGNVNSRGGFHTTPLHAASLKGYLDVASLLLENGADLNSRDDLGRTPLHKVSQGGQIVMAESSLEIARLLINSGANVDVTDDKGSTPLHAAVRSGYRDIAELLLESGANLEARSLFWKKGTPLHVACFCGKLDVSRFLIGRGSNINSRDNENLTPLHIASRCGHFDISRLLLDCGSDVNVRGMADCTPLHFAARYGFLDLARLLVERGANVGSHGDNGVTPLLSAAMGGHLDIVRYLIERGAAVSDRDINGSTPFHAASYFGHLHIVKFLLEDGVDVEIVNRRGRTSLYLASDNGKFDVVRFLIEHGADIHAKDDEGGNSLHVASKNGHLEVVQILVNAGIPVDIRNGSQLTPLAWASNEGKVEVGRFLIEQGANINTRANHDLAPLHFALNCGHFNMARLLLDHGGDPNIQYTGLWSPLHVASAFGHLQIAKLLVQRGASVDIVNQNHETPLYQAVTKGKVLIARLLIDHGANLHIADINGWTPLHVASHGGHLRAVELLLRRGAHVDVLDTANKTPAELASEDEVAKVITEYQADANLRNETPSTSSDSVQYGADEDGKDEEEGSLHAAAEGGDIDAVKSLLEQGVDINGYNASNQTALNRAAHAGHLDVVRLLIERGAEVNSRDVGWPPLHEAAQSGHVEVARVLIYHGANMNARNQSHWTAIHGSSAYGYPEIVKLLIERGADVRSLNGEGETPYQVSLRSGNREIADLIREHGG